MILKSTAEDWLAHPAQTTINALGTPVTSLDHPAITVCKENGIYDVGEYLRAVYNNFEFHCSGGDVSESCRRISKIRDHHGVYSRLAYLEGSKKRQKDEKVRCLFSL